MQGKIPIFSVKSGRVELVEPIVKTGEEWKAILPKQTFEIARQQATEPAFTGAYHDSHEDGIFTCACCGTDLFDAKAKFDSGTGWPSFSSPVDPRNVRTAEDRSHGMVRTEVLCSRCGAHLGHVFPDGPPPTGKRYCMNSGALKLVKRYASK
ncbi:MULTISPECIES: peptide-methionine (R)-S-oxide reductase MsrB [unclassified Methanoregula]|uniref:peptide-methionine (R)-S-oxide reductase MsrB n=1 Tax=unclassified Methanoregula TaxID=2649730 RepID=UPI0009CDF3BF|nr:MULTISPECIES: peptide-methionine (R)-S-oxide reductase MsrB [unclassified Methanoregula]OPX63188.1 MAG: Peptide methionine sulfoxide reductase MsrB [Methanoregula sp. PtaB.Bin085]OPY33488.1 MAG: Peptide methionine sulfoxide reductase MsrB [Methanoregula sp. PtaU1.Bin006]